MANHITEIRNAVAAAISASEIGVTATTSYLPIYNLHQTVEDMICVVVPKSATMTSNSRSTDSQNYTVDVAIVKQVSVVESEVADLLDLLNSIYRLFRGIRLVGYTTAICTETVQSPVYDALRLEKESLFLGVLSLTFQVTD